MEPEIALGEKGSEDEDERDSCNRRLQDRNFGATALLKRLVMLNAEEMKTMVALWLWQPPIQDTVL